MLHLRTFVVSFNTEGNGFNRNSVYNGRSSEICEEDIFDPQKTLCFSRSFLKDRRKEDGTGVNFDKLLTHPAESLAALQLPFLDWPARHPQPHALHLPPQTELHLLHRDCLFSHHGTLGSENCFAFPQTDAAFAPSLPLPPPCSPLSPAAG